MPAVVHYEVYTQDKRGWILQARFPQDERAKAVEDAKMLEFSLNLPVRVVREIYYPENNYSEETVVFTGRIRPVPDRNNIAGARRSASTAANIGPAPFSESDIANAYPDDPGRFRASKPSTRPRSTADAVFRVLLVLIMSLVLAVVGTGVTAALMNSAGMWGSGKTQSLVMFLIFLSLFVISAVPLVMKYVPLEALDGKGKRSRAKGDRRTVASSPFPSAQGPGMATPDPPEIQEDEKADSGNDGASERAEPEPEAEPPADPAEQEDGTEAADTDAEEPDATAAQAEEEADPEDAEDVVSPRFDKVRLVAMKFLGGAVNALKATHPQLDAYNKFGVNLYLAGACEALAEAERLAVVEKEKLIRDCVEVVGTRPDQAKQLLRHLSQYKEEPRYHQMIGAGRAAMEVYLSGDSDPFIAIGGVMKDWNTPQSRQVAASTVTIMFTDMVGSTDMTQALGDVAAQNVIRAHNHIVRTALSQYGGKEVKHTGDGIMASFDEPADAVKAAIDIQKRAAQHTARWPKLPLHLRIGMNTGEPIVEENDYFGATVQIAARVCAKAGSGEIWVSDETRSLVPRSTRIEFFGQGSHHLKGVKEKVRLFQVAWNEDRKAALDTGRGAAQAHGPEHPKTDTAGPAVGAANNASTPEGKPAAQATTEPAQRVKTGRS